MKLANRIYLITTIYIVCGCNNRCIPETDNITFRTSKLSGTIELDSAGNLKNIHYLNEQTNDSISYDFYTNGVLNGVNTFRDGIRNGLCIGYYDNGLVYGRSNFLDDGKMFWTNYYDTVGRLTAQEFHIPFMNEIESGQRLKYDSCGHLRYTLSSFVNTTFSDEVILIDYINPLKKGEYILYLMNDKFEIDTIGYSLDEFPFEFPVEKTIGKNIKYGCIATVIDTMGSKFYGYHTFEWKHQFYGDFCK